MPSANGSLENGPRITVILGFASPPGRVVIAATICGGRYPANESQGLKTVCSVVRITGPARVQIVGRGPHGERPLFEVTMGDTHSSGGAHGWCPHQRTHRSGVSVAHALVCRERRRQRVAGGCHVALGEQRAAGALLCF